MRSAAKGVGAFPDNKNVDDGSSESRISRILWDWRFTPDTKRAQLIQDSKLALIIEFWFPFTLIEQTQTQGTWCDGIVLLNVADLHRTAFLIGGVGYFPRLLAPFELEFHYQNRRDFLTTKIALRLGGSWHSNKATEMIYDRRPRTILEWSVAVELTPG